MARPSKQFKKFAASGKLKETIKSRRSHQQARRKSEDQRTQRAKQRGAPKDDGAVEADDDEEDEDEDAEKDARSVSRGGKAGGVAKTVEELFGGQLGGDDDEGSELEELSDEEDEDEEEEEDDEEEEDGELDEAAMKKAMKDLAKKDPEFFKYLEENDKDLLDFQAAGPSKSKKNAAAEESDDEDMEDSEEDAEEGDSDDEEDEDDEQMEVEDSKTSVTMKMLRQWQEGMLKQYSVRSLRKTLLAFRAAAHMNEDDADEGNGLATKYSIDSAQVFNKLVITSLKFTPVVLAHHIPYKTQPNGRIKLSQPKQTKTVASLNRLVLSHFSTLLHLIKSLPSNNVEEAGGMLGMAVGESSKLLPWVMGGRKHVRAYLKVLLDLWSSASDNVRIASFLAIRKLFLAGDDAIKDLCLRNTYRALLPPLRHTSAHTLPSINLTKNTAATLFALDPQRSYTHAFGFIRMLAVHLRNVVRSSTTGKAGENGEAFRAVYNWQFVHCIDFWSQVLAGACSEDIEKGVDSALRPLIYPLTQIALGVVRLLPSSRYFPLRFHILHSLLRIISKTNTYIPLSPFLLEIFDSSEFRRTQPKKSTLKPLDLEYIIRAPAAYPKTRTYQESLADELVFLLGAYHAVLSTSIAFPEMALPVTVALKRHIKRGTAGAPKVQNQIKTLVEKLEATGKWVEGKRRNVAFSPRDRGEVKRFLEGVGEEASPLGAWMRTVRKVREGKRREVERALREEVESESESD